MNHLDEGTIHAWIDGALDASQSRDIETHVAQCPTCQAAVAEARGLIAGASRILMALDDVPAGVTPKRATAPKRQWRAAPWVTGIAAAFVLAVGLTTWNRSRDSVTSGSESPSTAKAANTAGSASPVAPRVASPSAPPRLEVANTVRGRGGAAAKQPSRREAVAEDSRQNVARADEPSPAKEEAAARLAPRPVEGAERKLEKVADAARDSAAPEARTKAFSRAVHLDEIVVTSTPGAPSIPRSPLAAVSDVERSAGCYHVPVSTVDRITRDVKAAASGDRGRASAPAAAAAPAAGYVITGSPPPLLRLDLDTVPNRFFHIVRSAASDSMVGTWHPIPGDSVRVDLRVAGLYVFATKDRVACPQPR